MLPKNPFLGVLPLFLAHYWMRFFYPLGNCARRPRVLYFAVALLTQRWALLRLHRLPQHDFDDRVLSRMVKWAR